MRSLIGESGSNSSEKQQLVELINPVKGITDSINSLEEAMMYQTKINIPCEKQEFIQKVQQHLHQFEKVAELFYNVANTYNHNLERGNDEPTNILLYGPGGYAKSLGSLIILKELGLKAAIIECGSSTTISDIFGNVNIKVLQNNGIKQYNFGLSPLFNGEYDVVIFEEGLSMPPKTLTDLRTLLTQKYFNHNDIKHYLTTKFLVMLTNVDPDRLIQASNGPDKQSIEAIAKQRFPFQQKVEWESHTEKDYLTMLSKKFKTKEDFKNATYIKLHAFTKVMTTLNKNTGNTISPRTAGIAAGSYLANGIEGLRGVIGIDQEMLNKLIKEDSIKEEVIMNEIKISTFRKIYEEIHNANYGENYFIKIPMYEMIINNALKLKLDPSNHDKRISLKNDIESQINTLKDKYIKDIVKQIEIPNNYKEALKTKLNSLLND